MKIFKKCLAITTVLSAMWASNYFIFQLLRKKTMSAQKERFFTWRYGDIRYITAGSGKPLLLLHGPGLGAGLHEWEQIIAPLAKNHTVYAIDLLGFGGSSKPAISYSSYMYTQLIIDFVCKVIKEPTQVCASFQSADFAVICSAFNKNIFTKMVLVNPTGVSGTDTTVNSFQNNPKSQPTTPTIAEFWNSSSKLTHCTPCKKHNVLRIIMELPIIGTSIYCVMASKFNINRLLRINCEGVTKQMVDRYYEAAHIGGANSKYAAAAYLTNMFNTDIYSKLCSVDIPVNIILSGNLKSAWLYKDITQQNKRVKLTIFENTKSYPHIEIPKRFFRTIKR